MAVEALKEEERKTVSGLYIRLACGFEKEWLMQRNALLSVVPAMEAT